LGGMGEEGAYGVLWRDLIEIILLEELGIQDEIIKTDFQEIKWNG